MSPLLIIFACLVVAGGFLLLEMFLPTGGILGVASAIAVVIAIVYSFVVNQWLGVGLLAATVLLSPLLLSMMMRVYPHTPIGKKMVLTTSTPAPAIETARIGQLGRAVTALRPMGEGEFGALTIQVISKTGQPLPAGASIEVVAMRPDGVAVVTARSPLQQALA
jgi:membrane-bound ClpP family serine protease